MSRGLGHVQQTALLVLKVYPMLGARDLAARVFKVDEAALLTPAQYSSVRRALSGLIRNGHVIDLGGLFPGGRHVYCAREEAFSFLYGIYRAGGGARAFWPFVNAALFYGMELRRRRRESLDQLRRLQLHRWRHDKYASRRCDVRRKQMRTMS